MRSRWTGAAQCTTKPRMTYTRYAIYHVPAAGAFAEFGARWLGWDILTGSVASQFDLPGLEVATRTPHKYGFHGTLKPPFRLKTDQTEGKLRRAVADLAARTAPATVEALQVTPLGRLIALTASGDTSGIARIAAACVRELDLFRAAPTADELAGRRRAGLNPLQEQMLIQWGYPHVLDAFRFHITLTGRLPKPQVAEWMETAAAALPRVPFPYVFGDIALCGERADGRFELLDRYPLTG